jgi:hypothetical protein
MEVVMLGGHFQIGIIVLPKSWTQREGWQVLIGLGLFSISLYLPID